MTVTDPSGSPNESPVVETESTTRPDAGIVTIRVPSTTPNEPCWDTSTLTTRSANGAGSAVRVNSAAEPSLTASPAVIETRGLGLSSSNTATLADANADGV